MNYCALLVCILLLFVTWPSPNMALRPFAIHFDIEPMSLPDWSSKTQEIANQYLDLLQDISAKKGNKLDLVVDTSTGFNFINITRNGNTKPFYQWVLDYVDIAMLMCYRNVIEGPYGGLLSLSKPSVDYATNVGKKVIIGVETYDVEPDYITFFGMNTTYLESTLAQVSATYKNRSGFLGVAVHDWTSYQILKNTTTSGQCIEKSLFLWQPSIAQDASSRARYFAFARSRCITTTYLESQDLIPHDLDSASRFVNDSVSNGMNVQFLYGAANWAYPAQHPFVLNLVNYTRAFVEGLPAALVPTPKPSSAPTTARASVSSSSSSSSSTSPSPTTRSASSSTSPSSTTRSSSSSSSSSPTSSTSTTPSPVPSSSHSICFFFYFVLLSAAFVML